MYEVTVYGRFGLVDRYEIDEDQAVFIIRNCSELHYTNAQHTVVSSLRLLVLLARI